jgi:hypothetical protein
VTACSLWTRIIAIERQRMARQASYLWAVAMWATDHWRGWRFSQWLAQAGASGIASTAGRVESVVSAGRLGGWGSRRSLSMESPRRHRILIRCHSQRRATSSELSAPLGSAGPVVLAAALPMPADGRESTSVTDVASRGTPNQLAGRTGSELLTHPFVSRTPVPWEICMRRTEKVEHRQCRTRQGRSPVPVAYRCAPNLWPQRHLSWRLR